MEYTLITTFAIVITTLFVHQLANRILGIRLGIKPLALCGICSLFLSLVLPRIIVGFAGLAGTIGVLAVFAIIFAYFVAYYEDAQTDEPAPQAAPSFSTLVEDIGFTPGKPDAIPLPFATQLVTEEPIAIEEPVAEEPVAIEELVTEEPVAVEEPVAEESVAAQELDIYRENYHNVTEVAGTMTQRMSNPFEPILPVAQDLDSLLDYAFLHKENKAYEEALAAFRYILQLFPEDAAAPFVLIEIGNILKQLGAYDDAIQVFVDGRANVAVHADYQFEQEFINTIAYLRIIKNALIHHRLGLIPYHKIPANILDEINAEFREWRNLI